MISDIWPSEPARQARRKLLRLAAAGDDPEIAELAREILAGRLRFRDALGSSAYSEILLTRLEPELSGWADASGHPEDLLTEALAEIEEFPEPAVPPTRAATPADDEDFEQRTYLRRA